MRKLKLDLEHLAVESFTTATDDMRWGTVRAASDEQVEEPAEGEEVGLVSWFTCQTRCNQKTCEAPAAAPAPPATIPPATPATSPATATTAPDPQRRNAKRPVIAHGPLRNLQVFAR